MANLDFYQDDQRLLHNDESTLVLEGQLTDTVLEPSGHIVSEGIGGHDAPFNTLDEPIKDTILRDVKAVGRKFKHVLYPVHKKSLLRDWDLWGPLILCTFMATILQGQFKSGNGNEDNSGGPEFAEVFVIVWVGAMMVTLNTKLLGGHISFFQSVCVLGYCLLPLSLSLAVCRIVLLVATPTTSFLIVRLIITLIGLAWSSYAAMQFLGDCQPTKRKALAAYPMFLFFFIIAWMVVCHAD